MNETTFDIQTRVSAAKNFLTHLLERNMEGLLLQPFWLSKYAWIYLLFRSCAINPLGLKCEKIVLFRNDRSPSLSLVFAHFLQRFSLRCTLRVAKVWQSKFGFLDVKSDKRLSWITSGRFGISIPGGPPCCHIPRGGCYRSSFRFCACKITIWRSRLLTSVRNPCMSNPCRHVSLHSLQGWLTDG